MKKNEKRYHKVIGNKVASVYIQEFYLDKSYRYTDDTEIIDTCYYENISICVGKNRRANNDWYNGDKSGNKIHNKSTGTITTFMGIIDMLTLHILEFYHTYGYYCCTFTPTDDKRRKAYFKAIKRLCKKCYLTYRYVICDDDELMIWIE